MAKPLPRADAEARVERVFWSTNSIAGGSYKRTACSIYKDLGAISKEIGVPEKTIVRVVTRGSGYAPADCRRKKRK